MTSRSDDPAEFDRRGVLPRHATARGVMLLGGVLASAVMVALMLDHGHPAWRNAVILAAAVTGVSSVGGWLASRNRTTTPGGGVATALAGTALRILLPLAALGWLTSRGGPLLEAGCAGLIVAFYLALLATTILLHMMGTPE